MEIAILIVLVNVAAFFLVAFKVRRHFGESDLVFWAIFLGAAAMVFPAIWAFHSQPQSPVGRWPLYVGLVVALLALVSIWRSKWHLVAATVLWIAMGMALIPSRAEAVAAGLSSLLLVWYFGSRAAGKDPLRPA